MIAGLSGMVKLLPFLKTDTRISEGRMVTLDELRPEAATALHTAVDEARSAVGSDLLDLCAVRIGMLLGSAYVPDDPKFRAVADYAHSELFSETERLALEFAEQYVLDVANTPDELVAALRDRLGDQGLYAFVMGLYAFDQAERLRLSAAVHPGVTR